ncbi:MAG TPA: tyrosine-protein phosphatase [Isosphaeraceae bacterium]
MYRSAQLSPGALARILRDHHIRTVLNLRGANPEQGWYRAERAATLAAGATQVDVPMSSDQWLAHDQARTLVRVLDTGAYPLLIHCEWGAERTGLVAAIATLLRPGSTLADAKAQFSAYYLFVPVQDGRVMAGHLDGYEAWLRRRRLPHAPDRFRLWLAEAYRPGSPSREFWPYNPYPLVVVTRPRAAGRRQ